LPQKYGQILLFPYSTQFVVYYKRHENVVFVCSVIALRSIPVFANGDKHKPE